MCTRLSWLALLTAIALLLAPNAVVAQDGSGSDILTSTSSSTSPGEGGDEVSTNEQSTTDGIDAAFVFTDDSILSSSDWTSMQLAASATHIVVVVILVVLAVALLVGLGIGIWMTVKAPAGNETAFRRFLRHNRNALHQEIVAGHGPVLIDMGELFAVGQAYRVFADTLSGDQATLRRWLTEEGIEGRGASAFRRRIVSALLRRPEVFVHWLRTGALELRIAL